MLNKENKEKEIIQMKKIYIFLFSLLFTITSAMAGEKIIVLNTGSNNGTMFGQANAYVEDLKALGYDAELVSPGEAVKAIAILNSIPKNQPVLVNIDSTSMAKIAAGSVKGVKPLYVKDKDLILAYRDHFYVCTNTFNDNTKAFFEKGASFKVAVGNPAGLWKKVMDDLNKENGTAHQSVTYDGGGKTRAGIINKEVDFGFVTTNHTFALEAKGVKCFAEFTDGKKLRYDTTVDELSAGKNKFFVGFATGYALKNADAKLVKQLRSDLSKLFDNPNSAIVKLHGGKAPVQNYGWEESISTRVKWVNNAIDDWAVYLK